MPNSAWGIDLGNRALKAIKLTREGEKLRVEDFEVIEHEQILSISGDNKQSILQTALANFVQRHRTKGIPVGVAVSGQQSFARFIKLPPVEEKKIPEIVKFEAIQQIPFPLDDVEWSYQLFREKDSPDVEVGILAIKKDLVNRHISYFTKLGLNVQCVQMHPLAVYNAMYHDGRTTQTTMFMDSGAENTDLIITDGQIVWLRTLPIGGNNFTETLAKSFKLSFVKAEELKRTAATSKYAKQIFQAMRQVFADLVAETQRSIGFYASVHRDARITKIVAQGSTLQLPGLQKYLQQNLQLPVEKLDSFKALPPADAKLAAAYSENLISLAGAYGLALQTMEEAKITASLLPEHIRREKLWLDKTKWFAAAAATFVLGTALMGARYFVENSNYTAAKSVRESNKAAIIQANGLKANWNSQIQAQKVQTDREQIQAIKRIEDYRELWPGRGAQGALGARQGILDAILERIPSGGDLKQLEKIKRPERRQIVIRSILSEYRNDLRDVITAINGGQDLAAFISPETGAALSGRPADSVGSGPAVGGAVISRAARGATEAELNRRWAAGAQNVPQPQPQVQAQVVPPRGYVITVYGSTPNSSGESFINEALREIEKLNSDTQLAAGYRFSVLKAKCVGSGKAGSAGIDGVRASDVGVGAPVRGRGDWRAELTHRPTQPPAGEAGVEAVDATRDRVFPTETTENDTVFKAIIVVMLDPKPAAKTAVAGR